MLGALPDTSSVSSLLKTLVAVGLATVGCSPPIDSASAPIATQLSEATRTDGPWPFTSTDGVLRCRYPYQVTFTVNGVEYAPDNHAAQSGHFEAVSPILRGTDGPTGYVEINGDRQPVPAGGKGIGEVIAKGLDLCD